MACTAAVETEIDRHYQHQLGELGDSDPDLSAAVEDFRAEELEHKAAALKAGADSAPGYPVLSFAIRAGCRAAIAPSTRRSEARRLGKECVSQFHTLWLPVHLQKKTL